MRALAIALFAVFIVTATANAKQVGPSPSTSSTPTASPTGTSSPEPPRYRVYSPEWWTHLSHAEKLKVVEGAIDGLINGWWRAYTEYDTDMSFIVLKLEESKSKDMNKLAWAVGAPSAKWKKRPPRFSKRFDYYIQAIDRFYAAYPGVKHTSVGEILQCLSDKPWESCAEIAKLFK